ncbi:MAG: gliding motility-associated C-terminal domain-containing protein [Flavobacteriales bacterium]|nr:gliding motility-associated C-terminal domain-containing protein [Flavobacteriales bacterium]
MTRSVVLRMARLLALAVFAWPVSGSAQPCLVSYDFTASPLPVNGQYSCGQVVTFCLTISNWNTSNSNWIHGVVPVLGPGWDASSLTATVISPTQGGSAGTWGWFLMDNGTSGSAVGPVGPGFFFDLNNDGIPGNNYGDYVNGPCNFQFCWSVAVPTGPACVNGLDLSMTANVFGDSETGSWGASGCTGDLNPLLSATVQACQADAGLPGAIVVCEDYATIDLFALLGGTPDAGGTWTDPTGNTSDGSVIPATGMEGIYTYAVTEALAGCPTVTATVNVDISYNLSSGSDASLTLCADAPPLDLLSSLGGSPDPGGSWTGPDGAASTGTFDAAADLTGSYTYTVVPDAPCLSQSSSITLSVDPEPWAGEDATLTRCANDPAVPLFPLLGGSPDADGHWFDPEPKPHSGIINPAVDLSGDYAYVVLGTGACTHLVDTGLVHVQINPLPRVAFSAEPDSGCAPLEVMLSNDTPPEDIGAACTWLFGDGTSALDCNSLIHLYDQPGDYPVQLTVTSPLGCTDALLKPHAIHVVPAPEADFVISPNPGSVGNSTLFFTALDDDNVHYGWTLDLVPHGEGMRDQQWFPDALASSHVMCLNVVDRYGCVDTLCQQFDIEVPSIFSPNAFTPNGDGLNDKYFPRVLNTVSEDHLFQVFNRWGELIFSTTDPGEGWDGTVHGQTAPQGVYVWRLETLPSHSADKLELYGSVTLVQ